ncbi:ABC transporter permease protein [Bacillus sp. TS-2]|nr:ABC transporter permease protein [Bacillus sp. TS-2]
MRVLSTVPFTILRLLRDYISLILLLIVPLLLITVFSFIFGNTTTENGGLIIDEQAVILTLAFQLFGGAIVMSYIHYDLFSERKARMQVIPFNRSFYAFSLSLCGTVYSIMLGTILIIYSDLVLGVHWGSWLWSIFIVALMALLSSIVCLIFMFSVNNIKIAERLSEVYGVGFIILAGLFFPMPDQPIFTFINDYVNPLSLSVAAIEQVRNGDIQGAWFPVSILFGAIVATFIIMYFLGRRRFH